MGTKNNIGHFDCYAKALPGEPVFVLHARDSSFYDVVMEWCQKQREAISRGDVPSSDMAMVEEARRCALAGREWRRQNEGAWHNGSETAPRNEDVKRPLKRGMYRWR